MKQKKRDFSRREQFLIDGFIEDICRRLHLPDKSGELRQCAWAAFLSVYRDDPASFSHSSFRGWSRAYLIICDALRQEKSCMNFWTYGVASLDQPVSCEVPVPQIELLQAPHGDFQDNVCFHDYLRCIGDQDACRMAYSLMRGDSLAEIQALNHWSSHRLYRTYNHLRTAMEAYLAI